VRARRKHLVGGYFGVSSKWQAGVVDGERANDRIHRKSSEEVGPVEEGLGLFIR